MKIETDLILILPLDNCQDSCRTEILVKTKLKKIFRGSSTPSCFRIDFSEKIICSLKENYEDSNLSLKSI